MLGKLNIGDRIQIGGGYDMEPQWLNGKTYYIGTVKAFIPGQSDMSATIIELDGEAVFGKIHGKFLVLELRYGEGVWREKETVHVISCQKKNRGKIEGRESG